MKPRQHRHQTVEKARDAMTYDYDTDELEELCTCAHPRRQHMAGTGACCHLAIEGPRRLNLTCEDCHTFTPAKGQGT